MLLDKQIKITVFNIDNTHFEPIGELGQYTSLIWPDAYNGYANFELWAPINDENAELLKIGNVIWCGGDVAGVIEIVKSSVDLDNIKTFNVKGKTLEKYIQDRIVWGGYTKSGKTSTIMYDLVNKSCVNPSNVNRKIPYLECANDTAVGKQLTQYQKTGGTVYDALVLLAADSELGFDVLFRPKEQKIIFRVNQGIDRTIDQTVNDPVEFSTDLEDILSSSYYINTEDEKTMALVQGEDSGAVRKSTTVGEVDGVGYNRKELYVDARDLQSTIYNEDGSVTELTEAQYLATLAARGSEKLSEAVKVETFEAQIRVFGEVQYEYGVDYKKGDMVTVVDKQLGVLTKARITNVEEQFDEQYALVLTFGYAYPTILQKMNRLRT